jgi:hypothetical protein
VWPIIQRTPAANNFKAKKLICRDARPARQLLWKFGLIRRARDGMMLPL